MYRRGYLLVLRAPWDPASDECQEKLRAQIARNAVQSLWLCESEAQEAEAVAAYRCALWEPARQVRYLMLSDEDLKGLVLAPEDADTGPKFMRPRHRDLLDAPSAAHPLVEQLVARRAEEKKCKREVFSAHLRTWLEGGLLDDVEEEQKQNVQKQLGVGPVPP
jgi:hypothetical protein